MKKLEQAWRALQELPESEQDIAAAAILDFASQDRTQELSDEQVAEVRRRMAKKNPKTLTLVQLDERLRILGI